MIADCPKANIRHKVIECSERLRGKMSWHKGDFLHSVHGLKCKKKKKIINMPWNAEGTDQCLHLQFTKIDKTNVFDVFATLSKPAHWRFIGCRWERVCAPHIGSVHPQLQARSKSWLNLSIQYTSITVLSMSTPPPPHTHCPKGKWNPTLVCFSYI